MERKIMTYEGNAPYIFVSYAHKDSDRVMPILGRLAEDGYRIWYDDGIEPGSQWSENIAEHLSRAEVVLAFGSKNYVDSKNCRQEIEFSISEEKNLLVIWLEKTELTAGLKMRLSTIQGINLYHMDEDSFFRKLYMTKNILQCRERTESAETEEPGGSISFTEEKPVGGSISFSEMPPETQTPPETKMPTETQTPAVTQGTSVKMGPAAAPVPESRKKKSLFVPILIGVVGVALLVVGGILLFRKGGTGTDTSTGNKETETDASVTIAGEKHSLSAISLNIEDKNLTKEDLVAISKLKELKSLRLENCGLTGIGELGLSDLPKLTTLSLKGNQKLNDDCLKDIIPIKDQLRTLVLADTGVKSLGSLLPAEKLWTLSVDGCSSFSDLSSVAKMTTLRYLYISHTAVSSLEELKSLTELRVISTEGNGLKSLKGLENSIYLEQLYAGENELSSTEGMENMTQLGIVDLHSNMISDVTVLKKSMDELEKLDLSGNMLYDLSFLSSANKLSVLYMDGTEIRTLSDITGLPELEILSVRNCMMEEENPTLSFKKLRFMDASTNQWRGTLTLTSQGNSQTFLLMNNNLTHLKLVGELNKVFLSDCPISGVDASETQNGYFYLTYSEGISLELGQAGRVIYDGVPLDKKADLEKDFKIRESDDVISEAEEIREKKYQDAFLEKTAY